MNSLLAALIVLALLGALAWLARRGSLTPLQRGPRTVAIESAIPLGERRTLLVVAVDGRRLLLGLTPAHISLVTELSPPSAAARAPEPQAR